MKQVRMLFMAIGCIALLCAGVSTVSAQALPMDNTWFKVDASVKGEAFDLDNETAEKASIKRTAYMHIVDDAGSYALTIFSEIDDNVWDGTGGGTIPADFITDDGIFMFAQQWFFVTPDPTVVALYVSGKFKVKLNKDGSLKKATFKFLNASIFPSLFDPVSGNVLFGKVKVKAKMIDVDDLPAGLQLP